uniref:Uncharacterized protein n=1 Tax=Heterorhabditis bacteriophora TaxID=37862 RepID=A0A1I7WDW9_HETBA
MTEVSVVQLESFDWPFTVLVMVGIGSVISLRCRAWSVYSFCNLFMLHYHYSCLFLNKNSNFYVPFENTILSGALVINIPDHPKNGYISYLYQQDENSTQKLQSIVVNNKYFSNEFLIKINLKEGLLRFAIKIFDMWYKIRCLKCQLYALSNLKVYRESVTGTNVFTNHSNKNRLLALQMFRA